MLRFWNNDVLSQMDGVLQTIAKALDRMPPHTDGTEAKDHEL